MYLGKPISTLPCLSGASPVLPLKRFQCSFDSFSVCLINDIPFLSFQGLLSASCFYLSSLQCNVLQSNVQCTWLYASR